MNKANAIKLNQTEYIYIHNYNPTGKMFNDRHR